MFQDILKAIPLGIVLAFTIGPVFFVLLETSITKGFKAAITFDFGVVFGDIVFILIAYFSTSTILEKLKDEPGLFIFGGIVMLAYGIFSFIKEKKDKKKKEAITTETIEIYKTNYLGLFVKGFLLNFINIGILFFWVGIIIVFGPKLDMNPNRITLFFSSIIITYLITDIIKMLIAKQLKSKLTPYIIYKIKRVISVVVMIFGFFLILQGFFPEEKEKLQEKVESLGINK